MQNNVSSFNKVLQIYKKENWKKDKNALSKVKQEHSKDNQSSKSPY